MHVPFPILLPQRRFPTKHPPYEGDQEHFLFTPEEPVSDPDKPIRSSCCKGLAAAKPASHSPWLFTLFPRAPPCVSEWLEVSSPGFCTGKSKKPLSSHCSGLCVQHPPPPPRGSRRGLKQPQRHQAGEGFRVSTTSCATSDRHPLGLIFLTCPLAIVISVLSYELVSVQGDGIAIVLTRGLGPGRGGLESAEKRQSLCA